MSEPLTLETIVADGDVTMQLVVDVTLANKKRLSRIENEMGLEPVPDPVPDPAKEVTVRFETRDYGEGTFDLEIWLEDLHDVDHFTSFEIQPVLGGQEFLGATKGEIVDEFGFMYNVIKESTKYGKTLGWTHEGNKVDGREDGNEDPELLVILHFRGNVVGAEFITFSQFSLAHNITQLPIAANPRITG